jgi:hypothetical protein
VTRLRALIVALFAVGCGWLASVLLGRLDWPAGTIHVTQHPVVIHACYVRWMIAGLAALVLADLFSRLIGKLDFTRAERWFVAVEKMPENVQQIHDATVKEPKK